MGVVEVVYWGEPILRAHSCQIRKLRANSIDVLEFDGIYRRGARVVVWADNVKVIEDEVGGGALRNPIPSNGRLSTIQKTIRHRRPYFLLF